MEPREDPMFIAAIALLRIGEELALIETVITSCRALWQSSESSTVKVAFQTPDLFVWCDSKFYFSLNLIQTVALVSGFLIGDS